MTDAILYQTLAATLTAAAVVALGYRLNGYLIRRKAARQALTDAAQEANRQTALETLWRSAVAEFDGEIAARRRHHKPIRDVVARKEAFIADRLRGERTCEHSPSAWRGAR